MRKNILNNYIILGLVSVLMLSSCGSKRKAANRSSGSTSSVSAATANSIKTFEMNNLDFLTFSGRAKAKVGVGRSSHDVTANIRIERDKAIWISVTALLGIEAARILITPDSVKILNKLQSEYIAKPFSYIYQYTNPGVTFKTLQEILVGNISTELLRTDQVQVASSDNEVFVIGEKDGLAFQYGMNDKNRPYGLKLNDTRAKQELEATYADYGVINGYVFPQRFILNVSGEDVSVKADMSYNRLVFNETIEMPFVVPSRYTVVK